MSEDTVSRLLETLPPETVGVALLCAEDAARPAASAAGAAGVRVASHRGAETLLESLASGEIHLVLCDAQAVPDAAAFAAAVKSRAASCRVALVLDGAPRRGAALPRGVDHFVVRPVTEAALAALFAEFLDTRRRMRALEAFSLMSRKKEIIGEISSFNTHLKSITRLKDRNRESEERIGELEEAKERLAAEIRARDAELRQMRERLEKSAAAAEALRGELAERDKGMRARSDEVREGVDALREIRDRLARVRDAAGLPPATRPGEPPLPDAAAIPSDAQARIRELELRVEAADRIFARILAVLQDFVAAEKPDLEAVFDGITAALAEFTSL